MPNHLRTARDIQVFVQGQPFPIGEILDKIVFRDYRSSRLFELLANIPQNRSFPASEYLGGVVDSLHTLRQANIITQRVYENVTQTLGQYATHIGVQLFIQSAATVELGQTCSVCNKNKANFMEQFLFEGDHVERRPICKSCRKATWRCHNHNLLLDKSMQPDSCPLYKRCTKKNYCKMTTCLERHARETHKNFETRKWKKANKFFSKKPGVYILSDIPVGVELEAIGGNHDSSRFNTFKLDKNIGIGSDLSIRGYTNPIEAQTPTASGIKLEKLVVDICRSMRDDGLTTNEACGLHIHLDTASKYGNVHQNPKFYKNLFAAYTHFEMGFFALTPRTRIGNRFAAPLIPEYAKFLYTATGRNSLSRKMFSKIWYQCDDMVEINRFKKELGLREGERCSGSHHHRTKYLWANFHSLLRNQGIEIRSLEGTLDSDLILNWIALHQAFIEKTARIDYFFVDKFRRKTNNWEESFKGLIEYIAPDKRLTDWINGRKAFCDGSKIGMNPAQMWMNPLVPRRNSGNQGMRDVGFRYNDGDIILHRPSGTVRMSVGDYNRRERQRQQEEMIRALDTMEGAFVPETPPTTRHQVGSTRIFQPPEGGNINIPWGGQISNSTGTMPNTL